MSVEENKEFARKAFQAINAIKGDSAKIRPMFDEFYSPDFVAHLTTGDMNLAQYEQYVQGMFSAFPDAEFTFLDLIAEGDKIVLRVSWSATHKGELQGIPPTGKRVTVTGVSIYRISDGKLIEAWYISDTLGMMQQVGAIPSQ